MNSFRMLAGIFLMVASAAAQAQTPYRISGLHTDMALTEAVTQAELLGGICAVKVARANDKDKTVQCEYSHCIESNGVNTCEQEGHSVVGPSFSSHPILSITLVASGETAPLRRIVMVYKGDADAVAEELLQAFGPTETGAAPTDKKSWSSARRWGWVQDPYRMGLLNSPQLIILSTDPGLLIAPDS